MILMVSKGSSVHQLRTTDKEHVQFIWYIEKLYKICSASNRIENSAKFCKQRKLQLIFFWNVSFEVTEKHVKRLFND